MQTLEPSTKIDAGFVSYPSGSTVATSTIHTHDDDPRWQLAKRIAASGSLGRSRLLADFLLYIVDRHIRDLADEITEQQIGYLVFGRAEGYDSNEDNIVRSYARSLRKRIKEYFASEGKQEPLRLEIPRGGYAPVFSSRQEKPDLRQIATPAAPAPLPDLQPTAPSETEVHAPVLSSPVLSRPRFLPAVRAFFSRFGVFLALCAGVLAGFLYAAARPNRALKHVVASPATAASAALWSQIFSGDRDTFIVPSDDGLVIMQRLTERPVPLASYVSGTYRANIKVEHDPA